ncbi:hypothetical protein [Rhodococcus daqingensis]|uniref:Uncharacterized protein n=1 Tax=Rhodococcus daqingensis TaxID=2479363 RepID=A0ABW2RVQ8_9NOCA
MSLAIAGFVLSVVALVWNFALTWVRWPRIGVELRKGVTIRAGEDGQGTIEDTCRLLVINQGAEAVTIGNVGLIMTENGIVSDYENLQERGKPLPEGPELPARIEGHGYLAWKYDESLLTLFPYQSKVFGYADRYKTFRRWPRKRRSIIHRTRSLYSFERNGGARR